MGSKLAAPPVLYIFSGLPGTGKTTLSQHVARHFNAAYIRIDTIENALRELCSMEVHGEGYQLSYRTAFDNLLLGLSVVADSCNPIELTRRAWEQVARETKAQHVNIEILCSDLREHRRRVETRVTTLQGHAKENLQWADIEKREYHSWTSDRIVIDTANKPETESISELITTLTRRLS